MDVNQTYEQIEYLRDYFLPVIETGTVLPSPKDVVDGTEFILVEGTTKTPHKMISGKWHLMVADANSIIRYEEL